MSDHERDMKRLALEMLAIKLYEHYFHNIDHQVPWQSLSEETRVKHRQKARELSREQP